MGWAGCHRSEGNRKGQKKRYQKGRNEGKGLTAEGNKEKGYACYLLPDVVRGRVAQTSTTYPTPPPPTGLPPWESRQIIQSSPCWALAEIKNLNSNLQRAPSEGGWWALSLWTREEAKDMDCWFKLLSPGCLGTGATCLSHVELTIYWSNRNRVFWLWLKLVPNLLSFMEITSFKGPSLPSMMTGGGII